MYLPARLDLAAANSATILADAGLAIFAKVWDTPRALDLGVLNAEGNSLVVRCVEQAAPSDYLALKTMVAQGDFVRAFLVYCNPEQPHLSSEIETWPIGDVERLATSLASDGASL